MISGLEPSWTALVARVVATAKINPQCSQVLEEWGQNERLITIARKRSFSASSASTIAARRAGSEGTSTGRIGIPEDYRIGARFTIHINQITPPEGAFAPVAERPSSNRGHQPAWRIAPPSIERPRPGSAAR